MPTATISKWGNAKAVRIPKIICEEVKFKEGDKVSLFAEDNRIIIEKSENDYSIRSLMKNWDGERYVSEECDWGCPRGSEIW